MALYGGGECFPRGFFKCLIDQFKIWYISIEIAVFGPVATHWYRILQKHVVLKSTAGTAAARVTADQVIFAPIQLTVFLSSMAIMEGSDPVEKWRNSFVPSYKANLIVWPFVQGINFTFVPLELRVLVVNVVSLGESFFFIIDELPLLTWNLVHGVCWLL